MGHGVEEISLMGPLQFCVTIRSRPRTHGSLKHLFFLGSLQHSLKSAPKASPPFLELQQPFSGLCCLLSVLCGQFFLGSQPAHRAPQGFSTSRELQAFLWTHCVSCAQGFLSKCFQTAPPHHLPPDCFPPTTALFQQQFLASGLSKEHI